MIYKGYWFYGLRNDEIIQAKDLTDEYYLLNCPQEYDGPFRSKEDAELYKAAHPGLSEKFNKDLQEYYEYCNPEINYDWDNYIYQDELC